ncbi:MAG: translation elongation factor G [Acidobacteria bacterium RIFCSPLOWO2_12_FULL_59_11]|nr:MAG: translation elongation factor G [Acidobacteria bacterium RIFCSPLOWO2_12_FULL_59_11]
MKAYPGRDIRNIGVIGHGDSGKTTLVAAFLYTAGLTSRLGSVSEGTTTTDFDEEEIERKVTISTSLAYLEWNKTKVNLLDTPGFNIFINDTLMSLAATDSALVLVDGVAGVEVVTEKVWEFSNRYSLPRALVVNKLDRDNANFERALQSIQEIFGRSAVPIHWPIGQEKAFRGVVDLLTMKAYTYSADGKGKGQPVAVPEEVASAAEAAREKLIEIIAESNDAYIEEFFNQGTLSPEHILAGLQEAVATQKLYPILCASALNLVGIDLLLNFAAEFLPSPVARGNVAGNTLSGESVDRAISDEAPASLFVFKTVADPFAGRLSYFKVNSGVLVNDANLTNYNKGTQERLAHISILQGKEAAAVAQLHAGDIGAVAKLKDTLTGDTLGEKAAPILYPPVKLPDPAISFAIATSTRADEDRLSSALHKILEEDPSLRFYRDPQTNEFLLAGAGQQHVEVVVSHLKRRYNVHVTLKAPKVPYRETIRGIADVQGRYKKQTGGHGQYGDCKIRMEPLPRGGKFEFLNEIFGGAIPKNYIPAVEKGIVDAAQKGFLAGYPVVDFRVALYDGSYHDVDSSELAFKIAGSMAFKKAMEQASPVLLEPIMNVEVYSPVTYSGDIIGGMNSRRGRIQGMETRGHTQVVKAQVPMAEMLTYASDLTSMTQGRGSFSMEFSHYDIVPPQVSEKIIAAAKAERAGEGAAEEA